MKLHSQVHVKIYMCELSFSASKSCIINMLFMSSIEAQTRCNGGRAALILRAKGERKADPLNSVLVLELNGGKSEKSRGMTVGR